MSSIHPIAYIREASATVVPAGKPGGDPANWARLNANESSYGAGPAARKAVADMAGTLERYPDPSSTALRNAIGEAFGLPADQLICGNGSEAVVETIARCYARPGDEILFSRYSFIQYKIFAERIGATAVLAEETDYRTDIDTLLAAVTERTKIVFVANPNNPTATHIPAAELKRLRDGLRADIMLVIDSAYAEFADADDYSTGHELVDGTENVVVARTFSKAYGLAALRVGWAHGPASVIRVLNRMKQIGNVNVLGQAAAIAALGDQAYLKDIVSRTIRTRRRTAQALAGLGLHVLPSQGNFLCVRFADGVSGSRAAFDHLMAQGIMVRKIEDYGLPEFLRMSIGTDAEMDRLLEALSQHLRLAA